MQEVLEDTNLSWKAKGLYMALEGAIEDGKCSLAQLQEMSTDGKESTAKAVQELIKRGYVSREQVKEGGRYVGCKWTLTEGGS